MRKLVLLSTVLFATPFTMNMSYGQCVNTLDCQALGYNKPSCINGGVKCPTGNYWYCPKDCEEGYIFINGKCVQEDGPCTYGDIYYHDGTCQKEYDSSKTPMGVVAYDENGEKWIISLFDQRADYWGINNDIPQLTSYREMKDAITDIDACANTQVLINLGASNYPAAKLASEYKVSGVSSYFTSWCLPSAGIWNAVSLHLNEVDAGIQNAKGGVLAGYYWSSTEHSGTYAWRWHSSGSLDPYYKNYFNNDNYERNPVIRPVMKIK